MAGANGPMIPEKNMHKIFDNFLEQDVFQNIQDIFFGNPGVPWYYEEKLHAQDTEINSYFYHILYGNVTDWRCNPRPNSEYFDLFLPLLHKMNCKSIINVRANLYVKKNSLYKSLYHCDAFTDDLSHNTAIFYLNTCDGGTTLLIDEQEMVVRSVANRLCTFPASVKHKIGFQTDTDQRIIININYF